MNSRLARLLGALLAITLIAAACGGDDDDTTTAVGQPAGEDGEAEAPSEDDVDPDAANCAADGADCGQMVDETGAAATSSSRTVARRASVSTSTPRRAARSSTS